MEGGVVEIEKQMNGYFMRDPQGRLVPVEMVSEVDRLRDSLVREIVTRAAELSKVLARFKASALDDIAAFVEISAEKYDAKLGGEKGNVMLTTFDGEYRIIRAVAEYLVFDERLQVAKSLIDECITEWSTGASAEIRVLVNDAFYVDKQGKLNTNRILGLRRLNIDDEKWKAAMDAIGDSLQVVGSKTYVRIYKRIGKDKYQQISLDVAAA